MYLLFFLSVSTIMWWSDISDFLFVLICVYVNLIRVHNKIGTAHLLEQLK